MPAAAFFPLIATSLLLPMMAFAVVRLGWFFSRPVGKKSGVKILLLSAAILSAATLSLFLLKGVDWSGIPFWLRLSGVVGLMAILIASAAVLFAVLGMWGILVQLASKARSTWLTGLAMGIVALTILIAIRVGVPTVDMSPLLLTDLDMLQLRSIDLMTVAAMVLGYLCLVEGDRTDATSPANDISPSWRVGLAVATFTIFSKLVGQDMPTAKEILWFAEERLDIAALRPYEINSFQEILIAFWQSDAISILVLTMIAALLLLPAALRVSASPRSALISAFLVASLWFMIAATFAVLYPAGEFAPALPAYHRELLVVGLASGAVLGAFMNNLIDMLGRWRQQPKAPYIVRLVTPTWLLLIVWGSVLIALLLMLPNPVVSTEALTIGMAVRFGIIALAAIWSIRHCATIYRRNIIDELIDDIEKTELEASKA